MPIPPFHKPDYLAEARSRVTEQFKLPEPGIVVEIPSQTAWEWFVETYGEEFAEWFPDKLQYLINEKYPLIFDDGGI